MSPIKKVSLVDQVYSQLRSDIIALRYPLGSRINVNELQTSLGVSCTPIREALNRLQQEGLLTYENNIGARVLTLTAHDVVEIQQLASTLHSAAIKLAMAGERMPAVLEGLETQLAAYKSAASVEDEVKAINGFYGAFYLNCGNRRLDGSMLSLQGQQLLLRYLYAQLSDKRGRDADIFKAMLNAARAGDTDTVCKLSQQYSDDMTAALIADPNADYLNAEG